MSCRDRNVAQQVFFLSEEFFELDNKLILMLLTIIEFENVTLQLFFRLSRVLWACDASLRPL